MMDDELNIYGAITIVVCLMFIVLLNETGHSYYRNYNRFKLYREAVEKSIQENKPLIVIGDPHNGLEAKIHGVAYGSGDYMIDISGCSMDICKNVIKEDLIIALSKFENNQYIIFSSCVLEFLETEKIEPAINEMKRVAGGINNIYNVVVGTSSLLSYYYKYNDGNHDDIPRRVFLESPPNEFKWQELKRKN